MTLTRFVSSWDADEARKDLQGTLKSARLASRSGFYLSTN